MIETLPFGRTGHTSTRALFGGAALSQATHDEADRTLDLLLAHGVNHIDTAASYGDAELRIGPWMERYRSQFFLATKTGQRGYQGQKKRSNVHSNASVSTTSISSSCTTWSIPSIGSKL